MARARRRTLLQFAPGALMQKISRVTCLAFAGATICLAQAQPPAQAPGRGGRGAGQAAARAGEEHILVIGGTKGFEHDSVPIAMPNVWKWGQAKGLWDGSLGTGT